MWPYAQSFTDTQSTLTERFNKQNFVISRRTSQNSAIHRGVHY